MSAAPSGSPTPSSGARATTESIWSVTASDSPAPASVPTTRTARRSANTSGRRCSRPRSAACSPETVPSATMRCWSRSTGRARPTSIRRWPSATRLQGRECRQPSPQPGSVFFASSSRTSRPRKAPCRCRVSRTARSSTRLTSGRRSRAAGRSSPCFSASAGRTARGRNPNRLASRRLEAEHMVDRDDREILSLLIGASNGWYQGAPYEAGYPRLSRYVLNGPLEDRVLPMVARTGRAHLDSVGEEQGLLPDFLGRRSTVEVRAGDRQRREGRHDPRGRCVLPRGRADAAQGAGPAAQPRIPLHAHLDGEARSRRGLCVAGAPPQLRADVDSARGSRRPARNARALRVSIRARFPPTCATT